MSEAKDRAQIGKYAAENGNAAAVHKYGVGESTARLFKTKFLAALSAQMKKGDSEPVTAIAPGRRGRPLLLEELDKKVQAYVRALRDAGSSVGFSIVIAAAEGIVTAHDRTQLNFLMRIYSLIWTRLVDRYFPLLQVTIPMCLIPYNTMCFIIHL